MNGFSFWRNLWSVTEQKDGNIESICGADSDAVYKLLEIKQGSSGQTFWCVVCLAAFLFQNNLQKLCTPTFSKINFLFENTGNKKLPSTTTKCLGFQYFPPFFAATFAELLTAYLWCNISLFYSAVPGCYRNWSPDSNFFSLVPEIAYFSQNSRVKKHRREWRNRRIYWR